MRIKVSFGLEFGNFGTPGIAYAAAQKTGKNVINKQQVGTSDKIAVLEATPSFSEGDLDKIRELVGVTAEIYSNT